MSKGGAGSRARNKLRRKNDSRKEKEARKALYTSQAGTGKKKKPRGTVGSFNPKKHQHDFVGSCGNPGCSKCFPEYV